MSLLTRPAMKMAALLGLLMVALLAATFATSHVLAAPAPSTPSSVAVVAPGKSVISQQEWAKLGFSFSSTTTVPTASVGEDQAITIARGQSGMTVPLQAVHGKASSSFVPGRSVWIVLFRGGHQTPAGPILQPGETPVTMTVSYTGVVIDDQTGAWLDTFTIAQINQ